MPRLGHKKNNSSSIYRAPWSPQIQRRLYTVGKKLHPFCFLNNFVKSCSILIIFGAQIPELICNKTVQNYSPLLIRVSLHYLVKHNVCQSAHKHSNVSIKRRDKLIVMDKHTTKMFKMFAFGFNTCIKTTSPLINAWSMTLCWIPDHAAIRRCFSSSTFLTASDKRVRASLPMSCSPQDWDKYC